MINNLKIFVCHHIPAAKRKQKLDNFFAEHSINVEYVTQFLPETIEKHYDSLVGTKELFIDTSVNGIQQNQYKFFKNAGKRISINELSLYLKHKYCWEQQIKHGWEHILILEDDVVLPDNFVDVANNIMLEFREHIPVLDCAVLGTAFNFKPLNLYPNKLLHFNKNQLTRCSHAILYTLNCAEKILKHLYPINWPIDFKLNEIMILDNLNVAWLEPGFEARQADKYSWIQQKPLI